VEFLRMCLASYEIASIRITPPSLQSLCQNNGAPQL
jgi:hypothetical protein